MTQIAPHIAGAAGADPGSPPLDAAAARHLIAEVNSRHDLQSAFGQSAQIDEKTIKFWQGLLKSLGHFFDTLGHLLAPLGPAMPYIAALVVIGFVALLLSPVVRLFLTSRFERLFARDHLRSETPWRPTQSAVAALLAEIDALAAKGEYDEAVHLLLVRSVADINAYRPDLVRKHFSARDILSHPLLPPEARPAFAEIVACVESSYFAGKSVDRAGFEACRAAYVAFAAVEATQNISRAGGV
ncbi:hypothetical protein [Asticcacaulis sp. EMRT-3]|uniref:hypothetical protein n=1 Tax=Asticcacaulis sp. EMRT-3 TaxID=3040349 RepID=UPI0024AE8D81|nr:hypothetical protein [Asticcacaulis sp. EMRT-3]MDI7776512.1 hypothetical protein [Asticcacaulis sp. EMRT-3]